MLWRPLSTRVALPVSIQRKCDAPVRSETECFSAGHLVDSLSWRTITHDLRSQKPEFAARFRGEHLAQIRREADVGNPVAALLPQKQVCSGPARYVAANLILLERGRKRRFERRYVGIGKLPPSIDGNHFIDQVNGRFDSVFRGETHCSDMFENLRRYCVAQSSLGLVVDRAFIVDETHDRMDRVRGLRLYDNDAPVHAGQPARLANGSLHVGDMMKAE